MPETFFDNFHSFISIGIDGMSFGVDQGTKLNDKLLKPIKVKLLSLSLF